MTVSRLMTALLLALAAFGCGHTQSGPSAPVISGEQAQVLVRVERAQLVDVRSAAEFDMGHLQGAINVPLGRITEDPALSRDRPVVVYCLSGHRSARAASALLNAGVEVYDLGSLRNWD